VIVSDSTIAYDSASDGGGIYNYSQNGYLGVAVHSVESLSQVV
jgi:hypothetical protein